MSLTDNQKKAIDIRDANVLVSAAAGSGKTMVLTERIVSRIISREDPVDVDRLLVMTYTNAAASEMQARIRDAINKRLDMLTASPDADPDLVSNLEKQSILVHAAQITTIHGFCKRVITDHFEEVGLDPNFRVADENECKLIRQDALEECMEAAYEKADPGFLAAAECFSNAKNDSGLAGLIIPVYEFIMANPEPESFIRECAASYAAASFGEFESSSYVAALESALLLRYEAAKDYALCAAQLIDKYEELAPYRANVDAYIDAFDRTDKALSGTSKGIYDILRTSLGGIRPPAFGKIKGNDLPDDVLEAKDEVKRLRDAAKDQVTKLVAMMTFDLKTSYEHMRLIAPAINALADTVLEFKRIYDDRKRAKNIIDFGDMEHMAVAILRNPAIAQLYREQFAEIYVDEYQDSNMTQETLISLICRHDPGNVFQVGDVKQSIYRFRQARPDIFLSKYNSYKDSGENIRILLNDNFRSRREVVDSVNEIFAKIMKAGLGGIEYDDDARLIYGADCYENDTPCENDTYRTELILGKPEELTAEEFEADVIAGRINAMIREGFCIYDKGEKITRRVSYGDFVILVRSIKKYESVFRKVFRAAGIPLAVNGREGYFGTVEVKTALAFLSAVDNPLCDIPLASVATSPVGGFSDKELARISAASDAKCLYDRMREAADGGCKDYIDSELSGKCAGFLEMLREYRVMSTYTPVYGILSHFYDNEYADIVKCMDNSGQRMANLAMLLTKAEEFGRTSFKGLYQFVRYMDQIRRYSIDDGEAQTAGEADDVVRLMTMHGSKGLEFPVCFVAGVEKRRNTRDEGGKLIWNVNYGFGADFTDLERRVTGETLLKTLIREDNRRESIAEEMRVLYVALTRAREKLIVVGTGGEDVFEGTKDIDGASSYLDMIKAAKSAGGFRHIDIIYKTEEDLVDERLCGMIEEERSTDELLAIVREYENGTGEEIDRLPGVPSYMSKVSEPYPYPLNPNLRVKLSVSDLKHQAIEDKIAEGLSLAPEGERLFGETMPDRYIPRFARHEGESATGGTLYGTAFHRIMELWDYTQAADTVTKEDVAAFTERMYVLHRIDRQQADAVRADDVAYFLNCPLGQRMRSAALRDELRREQPFVVGIDADGGTVLVQGIIDAYFAGNDGITIVDYKTDHVDDAQMLVDRYSTQLEYYGLALSQITKNQVKSLVIYSTRLRREIVVPQNGKELCLEVLKA